MLGELVGIELPWHRRHALQIAMQLPEDTADALAVLEATRVLVASYLAEDRRPDGLPVLVRDAGEVLMFPVSASTEPSR